MKKLLLLSLVLVALGSTAQQQMKYSITKTGAKYHTSQCKYAINATDSISLQECIAKGLTACKACIDTTATRTHVPFVAANSVQCMGTTKAGERCKLRTTSQFCHHHKNQ